MNLLAAPSRRPIVIGHRGACGYLPEHTLASYWLAIEQGADYVEPDLVATRDGVLVARHENAIAILDTDGSVKESTTDVHLRPEFAGRLTTKTIDGTPITGWFTEDFLLSELKTLRAVERLPHLRVANTRFDRMFEIPTFEEILRLVEQANAWRRHRVGTQAGEAAVMDVRPIGIYPETKHPSYFRSIGLPLEEPLVETLHAWGYRDRDAPVFVQSFEFGNLREMRRQTDVPMIFLVNGSGAPYDFIAAGDGRGYAELMTPAALADIAAFADGIGVAAGLVLPTTPAGTVAPPTALVADAHAAGLAVHTWTLRAENHFLPPELHRPRGGTPQGAQPEDWGDLAAWVRAHLEAGVDGFFTDHPFIGRQAVDAWWRAVRATA